MTIAQRLTSAVALALLAVVAMGDSSSSPSRTGIFGRANNNATEITVPLRIMPLGASVTFGVGSTTGDSYRKDLLSLLTTQHAATVEYVGTQVSGNDFEQNEVEAFPGFVIAQLADKAATSVPALKPSLVLADLGTNNCNEGGTVPDAGQNVTDIIERIYVDSPGATVVLATLLVNAVAAQEECRQTVNPQYEQLVARLAAEGKKIVLADMRNPPAPLVGLTTKDLNGTRHPNDGGYAKMAAIWQSGILDAAAKGFLSTPIAVGKQSNMAVGNHTTVASPTGGGSSLSTSVASDPATSTSVTTASAITASSTPAQIEMNSSSAALLPPSFFGRFARVLKYTAHGFGLGYTLLLI